MIKNDPNMEKRKGRAFLWNMTGSVVYSASSFLYLLIVKRICGADEAGFFSLCYATAQLLLAVGRYGMRTYQATDLQGEYTFREYGISRIITCVLMLIIGCIYSGFSFQGRAVWTGIAIVGMKMIDAAEDVYHGELQRRFNVEAMGKTLAFRNLGSMIVFTACLLITPDLCLASMVTFLVSLLVALALNAPLCRKGSETQRPVSFPSLIRLYRGCTPIFIGTFLSLLLYNIPKYAMANVLPYAYQTYYSILFMPSFAVTMLCEFLLKPYITTVAALWQNNRMREFRKMILIMLGSILFCGVLFITGGHLIGRWMLEVIYHVDLSPFKLDFVILLTGGGLSACTYMLYNILIAIRKEQAMLAIYAATSVITASIAGVMVNNWKMTGAALNYLFSCIMLFILFLAVFITVCRKNGKDAAQA